MSIRDALPFRQTTQSRGLRPDGLPVHTRADSGPELPTVPPEAPSVPADGPPEPEPIIEPEDQWPRRQPGMEPYVPDVKPCTLGAVAGSPSTGFKFLAAGQDAAEAVAACQQFSAPTETAEPESESEPERAKRKSRGLVLTRQAHGGALRPGGDTRSGSGERQKARETQELYLAALRRAVDPNTLELVLGRVVRDALAGKVSAQRVIVQACLPAQLLADVLLQQEEPEGLRVAGLNREQLDQRVAIHLMALVEKYQTKKENQE